MFVSESICLWIDLFNFQLIDRRSTPIFPSWFHRYSVPLDTLLGTIEYSSNIHTEMPPRRSRASSSKSVFLGDTAPIRKLKTYQISVFTSKKSCSIDAKVRILVNGSRGHSGWLSLEQKFEDAREFGFTVWQFQRGSEDRFLRTCFDLGRPGSLQIEHDGSDPYGSGTGWDISRVELVEVQCVQK